MQSSNKHRQEEQHNTKNTALGCWNMKQKSHHGGTYSESQIVYKNRGFWYVEYSTSLTLARPELDVPEN